MSRFILILLLYQVHQILCYNYGLTNQEYCQGDTFSPECPESEVVVISKARYGHIQLGHCLDKDFGELGCAKDELAFLDNKCSGRRSCNVVVNDKVMGQDLPCASSLLRYLEASYLCVKVFIANKEMCTSSVKISVKSRIQYLGSSDTAEFGCGMETKPWVLEAKPGQYINVSITDFGWKSSSHLHATCPVRYGYIIDSKENTVSDICGGTDRKKLVYKSKGNQIQIIIDKSQLQESSFLLSYQAIGCPTFISPVDTWIKKEEKIITVGCHDSTKTWKMRCIGNNWIGIVGTCKNVEDKIHHTENEVDKSTEVLGMSPVVAYCLLGSVFVVVICITVTLFIGIFCIRKPKKFKNEYYMTPQASTPATMLIQGNYPTFRRVIQPEPAQTLMTQNGGHDVLSQNSTPQYYVLENRQENQTEPIYDAVYQNITPSVE